MKKHREKLLRFLASEEGPTAVEYAVMMALIVLVCIASINAVGTQTCAMLSNSATSLNQVVGS